MPPVYTNTVKDNRMIATRDAIDAHTNPGFMEICNAGGSALVTITLAKPSFSVAAQTMTLLSAPRSGVASANGTATQARIKDGSGTTTPVSGLTVGMTSASDIVLNNVVIAVGATINITAGTVIHAP